MKKCAQCKTQPRTKKNIYCIDCNDIRKRWRKKRRRAALRSGLCLNCMSRPRFEGGTRCLRCSINRKLYYRKHRRKFIAIVVRYQKKNRRKIRNYLRNYNRDRRRRALAFLGGKCAKCGFSDERALQIDHKHGGGVNEQRLLKNSYRFYGLVLKYGKRKYQLLCANCNWIKKHENREI